MAYSLNLDRGFIFHSQGCPVPGPSLTPRSSTATPALRVGAFPSRQIVFRNNSVADSVVEGLRDQATFSSGNLTVDDSMDEMGWTPLFPDDGIPAELFLPSYFRVFSNVSRVKNPTESP